MKPFSCHFSAPLLSNLPVGHAGVTELLQGQQRPRPLLCCSCCAGMEGLDIQPHNVHTTLHTSLHLILPVVLEGQHCYANFTGNKTEVQRRQVISTRSPDSFFHYSLSRRSNRIMGKKVSDITKLLQDHLVFCQDISPVPPYSQGILESTVKHNRLIL